MPTPPPEYTSRLEDVVQAEHDYIYARRTHYGIQHPGDRAGAVQDLWGMCISGGGIRSATLGLGLLQKLIVEGVLKQVDYLSTVSGGGYIGACLSSLMNTDSAQYVQPPEVVARAGKEAIPGMDPQTNPLVGLIETRPKAPQTRARYIPAQLEPSAGSDAPAQGPPTEPVLDYRLPRETRLDVRHQIHHLRTHGEYLTPDKSLLSPDVQRAIGAIIAGILHNLILFLLALGMLVAIHYIVLDYLSDGDFIQTMKTQKVIADPPTDTGGLSGESLPEAVTGKLLSYWSDRLMVDVGAVGAAWGRYLWASLAMLMLGLGAGLGFLGWSRRLVVEIDLQKDAFAQGEQEPDIDSGRTLEDMAQRRLTVLYNAFTLVGGMVIGLAGWLLARSLGAFAGDAQAYWLVFSLPVSLALGNFIGVYTLTALLGTRVKQRRLHRAFFGVLRGGAFYALLFTAFMPFLIIFLFSFSYYFDELLYGLVSSVSSAASIGVGYLVAMTQKKEGGSNILSKLFQRLQAPLLGLSVLLFVLLAASAIARTMDWTGPAGDADFYFPVWVLGGTFLMFLLLGSLVNTNRLSLHYFYRDRLTEAYLRTNARSLRQDRDAQGMPLVNLRNDEDLRLKDLGWRRLSADEKAAHGIHPPPGYRYDSDGEMYAPNPRGPYHLIVTALNLQGSGELVRKDLKSEHFIFSRDYVGAPSTGYVRTDRYRRGLTKLARAMTISAAAVGSGMGFSTFFAQSFLTTLLNLRLGYWMENPWFYRSVCSEGKTVERWGQRLWLRLQGWRSHPGDHSGKVLTYSPHWRYTFWPYYLLQEMLGLSTANRRLVNVSDGGHTGDNLGLLPLLRRRCRYIIVADFEQDNAFSFDSFNHAVRMANIEENTDIRVDLRDLMPTQLDEQHIHHSPRSVVTGYIGYPDGSKGLLIYIKSSLSHEPLPVNVYNYHKSFPDFPHQSTADQYFDDAQFEAYRALGFHLGGEAAREIQRLRQ